MHAHLDDRQQLRPVLPAVATEPMRNPAAVRRAAASRSSASATATARAQQHAECWRSSSPSTGASETSSCTTRVSSASCERAGCERAQPLALQRGGFIVRGGREEARRFDPGC